MSSTTPRLLVPSLIVFCLLASVARADQYTFAQSQAFLKQYCESCHNDKAAVGGFRLSRFATEASLKVEAPKWTSAAHRIQNREMPPKGSPAPTIDEIEAFTAYAEQAVHGAVCALGPQPGPAVTRRLNRDEYAATLRDLLDIHLDIAKGLPADGAGGEGFDNAAETLFLSPLHSEKYMDMAKFAMDFAAKEYKPRQKILIAKPGEGISPEDAARTILREFLPKAFRRPVTAADVNSYVALFQLAQKQGETFDGAVFFALRAALVSPKFLFRAEPPNPGPGPKPVDQFALASRISYFLWGSMPDELLFDVAAAGKLHDPAVIRELVPRMLRNDRSLGFAQRFIEQWLRTRELAGDKAPDAKLYPLYAEDEELRGDIRFQPILFFRELLVQNLSLLNIIDSKYTIGTTNFAKVFQDRLPVRGNQPKQPQWVMLPDGIHRGGLLGMPAVLAVSSYPYRTSPVLRGAWILDSILGTPPPSPPANVPPLEEHKEGAAPKSMKERLSQHRGNPVCASCHSRIDPLGFALENFDVLGRWRDQDNGAPIDAASELADGTKINGPEELRKYLLERKDLVVRNLTRKLLGFALGRGLTLTDSCAVDQIVAKLKQNDYKAQVLIEEILLSEPFRMQAVSAQAAPVKPVVSKSEKEKSKP